MVLVISITMSNNGQVIYQISNDMYSERVIYFDEHNKKFDCLEVHYFDKLEYVQFLVKNGKKKISKEFFLPNQNELDPAKNCEDIIPFEINNYYALEYFHVLPIGDIEISQFYIKIPEIAKLTLEEEKLRRISIFDKLFLFVSFDLKSNDTFSFKPKNVSVTWKTSFSNDVKALIDN